MFKLSLKNQYFLQIAKPYLRQLLTHRRINHSILSRGVGLACVLFENYFLGFIEKYSILLAAAYSYYYSSQKLKDYFESLLLPYNFGDKAFSYVWLKNISRGSILSGS